MLPSSSGLTINGFTDFVTLFPTSNRLNPLLVKTFIASGGANSGFVGIF